MGQNTQRYDTIIIGAGLSGLSAGISLVDAKKRVLVLEARDIVGGRTSSWNEKDMHIESGLHRFLGLFTHLPNLIEKIGVNLDAIVHWEDEIHINMPDKKPSAVFALAPLFRPLQMTKDMLTQNDFLPPDEKAKVVKFFLTGYTRYQTDPKKLDTMTILDLAKEHELSNDTIERVLIPLTEGLFFLEIAKYGAYNFFALFAPYIPFKLPKSRVGAFKGGMTEVMTQPMATYIENHGGKVLTQSAVSQLLSEDDHIRGVKANNQEYHANHVILATSLAHAQALLRPHVKKKKWFAPMMSLASMPSVTFQIELTHPSMEIDRTTFSPTTIFSAYAEQSRTTFRKSKGRLSVILATPQHYLKTPPSAILGKILTDAKRLDITLSEKHVKDYRKVTWEKDFYSYECGTDHLRPEQKTPIHGLVLSGDYTRQKYLSTMEGAVYSGGLAAKTILENS